jgi:dephospho-CoA kinase
MKKQRVAITGNIGSGKSSFCDFLSEMNFKVIKADELAKEVMTKDERVKQEIIKQFGRSSYNQNGLNKSYLSEKVFSNPTNLEKINSIVHPVVVKKVVEEMDAELKKVDIVFHEAALIYEADIENLFDHVVLITSDDYLRKQRVISNYKLSEAEFAKREANQIPQEEKMKRADFTFTNNATLADLKIKAKLLIKLLEGIKV